jgi:hypothetical protein
VGYVSVMLHSRSRFQSWLPALFDGEFDWDFLLPAWMGTKIQPMDHDCVVERKGHFLLIETKIPGKAIDLGQSITLTQRWKQGDTVFVVSGKSPKEINGLSMYWEGKYNEGRKVGDKQLQEVDYTDVLFRCRQWFCWVNGDSVPKREEWDRQLRQWGDRRHE